MSELPIVAYELDLGDDNSWRPLRLWMSETLSRPYQLVIDAVSEAVGADTDALLGASATVYIARGEHEPRPVHGIIEEISYLGFVEHRLAIRVQIVPALALLRQRVGSRIWQRESVRAIISEVLEAGLGDYERSFELGQTTRGQVAREYCVQYRESELDFVTRLLEDEGLVYEFVAGPTSEHEVLTLRDANAQFSALRNIDGSPSFPIIPARGAESDLESIHTLEWVRTLTPTAFGLSAHDWTRPAAPVHSHAPGSDARGKTRQIYAHGLRRYLGDDLRARSEDLRAAAQLSGQVARGVSNITGLRPGLKLEIDNHERDDLEREYIVTQVIHRAQAPDIAGELGLDGGAQYENEFECVPLEATIRPRHDTPRPRIFGPQTAIVTGEASEEICVDEHGRIKVQFHWEPDPARDESASCWVRCAQSWAGLRWGAQFIPRVGMEVVVEFLDGDPDRPLVTGCVYNGVNLPPFSLPDNKTQSGILSQSSPAGPGFNALRFEDAKGNERLDLRAQKDLVVEALNDAWRTIGHDEIHEVRNDRRDRVVNDETREVGHDLRASIGNDETREVAQRQTIKVGSDRSDRVEGSLDEHVTGKASSSFGAAREIRVSADDKLEVGASASTSVGASYTLEVTGALALDTKDAATLEAAAKVLIKCGGASIELNSSGDLVLKGANIKLDALGTITTKGGSVSSN